MGEVSNWNYKFQGTKVMGEVLNTAQTHDRRGGDRFEPAYADVLFSECIPRALRARVLDISPSGLAVALSLVDNPPDKDVSISLVEGNSENDSSIKLGKATIKREWSGEGVFGYEKGIALRLHEDIPQHILSDPLLRGRKQDERTNGQKGLLSLDVEHLSNYRRSLSDCQIKFFILALTVGMGLAGSYFGLTYHSVSAGKITDPNLALWRTFLAVLPGCLAIACAFMVVHKSISIQRIDAYLSLVKKYSILGHFPREYSGWETDLWRFKNILSTSKCSYCKIKEKCDEEANKLIADNRNRDNRNRGFTSNPRVDLFHIIVHLTFFTILVISLITVLSNVIEFKLGAGLHMVIAAIITIVLVGVIISLVFIFYHLRKGRYSVDYFRSCWRNVLAKCREPI